MGETYVLDTHALIWFLEGNSRLGRSAKQVLENPESKLILPAIVIAEACWVIEHGRSQIPSIEALLEDVDTDHRVMIAPLTRSIIAEAFSLTQIPEMHDRLIVATALEVCATEMEARLITKDSAIQKARLVELVW